MIHQGMPHDYRQGLQMALQGEIEAVQMYTHMASIAPNPEIGRRIRYIKEDEARHVNFFSALLALPESGKYYPATMQPAGFWDQVASAYRDEVEAAMMYAHLSLMAPNLAIAARIRDVMRDEVTHGEFFATLLMAKQPGYY